MTSSCKNKSAPEFIECTHCTMQSICQPITTDMHALDLTGHYLSRRIPHNLAGEENSLDVPSKNQQIKSELFTQGQKLFAIFAVCSGVFKLYQTQPDGHQKIIGFRFPGELIAEDAIFLKSYNYNAIAISKSTVCKVSMEQFNGCGKLAPELQSNLIELLAKQSYEQHQNTQSLIGTKSSEALLAAFLLNICSRNAAYSKSDTEMDLVMSRSDIASFLGIRRETLSRLLTKLQQSELIRLKGAKLTLLSIDGIKSLIHQ